MKKCRECESHCEAITWVEETHPPREEMLRLLRMDAMRHWYFAHREALDKGAGV